MMGFGEALLAMWMAFAPTQGQVMPRSMAPAEAGLITVSKTVAYQTSTDSAPDFAVTNRPWSEQGGIPQWCNIGVMPGKSWNSRDAGAIDDSASMMFILAHETGHCLDSRPFKMAANEKMRREAFGDAFASCVMVKAGRREDLEKIARAREVELGHQGRWMRRAIEKAAKQPECQSSASHQEDFVDAWNVAARADREVFGEEGASGGAPASAVAGAKARAAAAQPQTELASQ